MSRSNISYSFPETFATQRLFFRAPELTDAQAIYATYAQDSDVAKYTTWRIHTSVTQTENYLKNLLLKREMSEEFAYLLLEKEKGELIGMITIKIIGTTAQIGYVIAKKEWNKGFGTEALKGVIELCFQQERIEKVISFCDVENKASARVMEKAGLSYVKTLPDYIVHPNICALPRSVLLHELKKHE